MLRLAQDGDIPPEANQAVGQEAIGLARRALEIHTQMYGLEHTDVAADMRVFAEYFNNVDDDEVLRLYEQSIAITARVEGGLSVNVVASENNLAVACYNRAKRARAAHDVDWEMANLEKALTHYRETARIYRAINNMDRANIIAQAIFDVEKKLRHRTIARAAAAARRHTISMRR